MTPKLPSWFAPSLALALVASLRLRLRHLAIELLKASTCKRLDYYKDFKFCDKFGVGKI